MGIGREELIYLVVFRRSEVAAWEQVNDHHLHHRIGLLVLRFVTSVLYAARPIYIHICMERDGTRGHDFYSINAHIERLIIQYFT